MLVKISYYPRWQVSGATGPYRVSPNLMVVVPTSKNVSLVYGEHADRDARQRAERRHRDCGARRLSLWRFAGVE